MKTKKPDRRAEVAHAFSNWDLNEAIWEFWLAYPAPADCWPLPNKFYPIEDEL